MFSHLASATRYTTSRPYLSRAPTRDEHLETILQDSHIVVIRTAQIKRTGHDFKRPCALRLVASELVAQPEVAWVLRHAAESVHGAQGVGFAVVFEPKF
jgi:hypothetical protein